MLDVILMLLICSISIHIVYVAYMIYNEHLRSKLLKSRAKKLAELDEVLDVQRVADKLESKWDRRRKTRGIT